MNDSTKILRNALHEYYMQAASVNERIDSVTIRTFRRMPSKKNPSDDAQGRLEAYAIVRSTRHETIGPID